MSALKNFYSTRVSRDSDLLFQVGHTRAGKPISEHELELMSAQINNLLSICAGDHVLDLCCGNGVFSRRMAGMDAYVLGVDFSSELIDVALSHPGEEKVIYLCGDIRRIDQLRLEGTTFDKVLWYASLQHFSPGDLRKVISSLKKITHRRWTLLIGFVPDRSRRSEFIGALPGRIERWLRVITRRDYFGRWWQIDEIVRIVENAGGRCRLEPLPSTVPASSYRINVLAEFG